MQTTSNQLGAETLKSHPEIAAHVEAVCPDEGRLLKRGERQPVSAAPLTSGGTRHPGRGRRALRTSTAQAGPSRVGGESRQPSCEEAGRGRPRGGVWSPVTLSGVATKGRLWGTGWALPGGLGLWT